MTDLDALQLDRADPSGMLATVERSGAMWRAAAERLGERAGAELPRDPAGVVVAGMGGSGIAGDVGAFAADREGSLPVAVVKGYELPAWVSSDHLVLAVSYSGNTAETLALVDGARTRGCPIAVVTSGGDLGRHAAEHGWWHAEVPGGHQPRASLPYLAVPVLDALATVGAIPEVVLEGVAEAGAHVDEAAERWSRGSPFSDNLAKRTAASLHGRVPVFTGGRGLGALVAMRAKCQVNENAAAPAFNSEVPERDHNEVVGWGDPPGSFVLVDVRSPQDEPEGVRARFAAAARELGTDHITLDLDGGSWPVRLAVGVLLVDLVSVYLAFLRGVDPTPVEPIERLKRRIASEASRA